MRMIQIRLHKQNGKQPGLEITRISGTVTSSSTSLTSHFAHCAQTSLPHAISKGVLALYRSDPATDCSMISRMSTI